MTERRVEFEACFNFRDLGGYRAADGRTVRWGRLFRADALHRLTDTDVGVFRALGLQTVIDLRGPAELEDHGPVRPEAAAGVAWHNFALVDDVVLRPLEASAEVLAVEEAPGDRYIQIVGAGSTIGGLFDLLATPGSLPAVFHCTAGKDRTGIVAAITLEVLGVPDDVIAADYALTGESQARSDAWIAEHEPVFAAFLEQYGGERRIPRPERILGFLAKLRERHGSAESFLLAAGLSPASIDRLRGALLEG